MKPTRTATGATYQRTIGLVMAAMRLDIWLLRLKNQYGHSLLKGIMCQWVGWGEQWAI